MTREHGFVSAVHWLITENWEWHSPSVAVGLRSRISRHLILSRMWSAMLRNYGTKSAAILSWMSCSFKDSEGAHACMSICMHTHMYADPYHKTSSIHHTGKMEDEHIWDWKPTLNGILHTMTETNIQMFDLDVLAKYNMQCIDLRGFTTMNKILKNMLFIKNYYIKQNARTLKNISTIYTHSY